MNKEIEKKGKKIKKTTNQLPLEKNLLFDLQHKDK